MNDRKYLVVDTSGSENKPAGIVLGAGTHEEALAEWEAQKTTDDTSSYLILERELGYNEYFPRIARSQRLSYMRVGDRGYGPLYIISENMHQPLPRDELTLSASLNQLTLLRNEIADIFRTVEADERNANVFGQRIRNIIIISAMEFESECRGVLRSNHYPNQARMNTKDYFKLLNPLRLDEYEIKLSLYPGIKSFKPFVGWNSSAPTSSISWYDAYNQVKHDRDQNISNATINVALNCVSAFAIMLAAQYRIIPNWSEQLGSFFQFVTFPDWDLSQNYLQTEPFEWKPVDYNF